MSLKSAQCVFVKMIAKEDYLIFIRKQLYYNSRHHEVVTSIHFMKILQHFCNTPH